MHRPCRGEVWLVDLGPPRGHEQGGTRPAMIISVDKFNHGPAKLVVVLPITSKDKRLPSHIAVPKNEAGLLRPSFIKCEDIRSVSVDRLQGRFGTLATAHMEAVESMTKVILGL